MTLAKNNILKYERADKTMSCLLFWENNGKIIERLSLPIKANKTKKTTEVYEANEALRMVKMGFHDG